MSWSDIELMKGENYLIHLQKLSEVRIFTGGTYIFVFFRKYVPLALDVYNRLFIDSLCFMAVVIRNAEEAV